MRRKLVAGCSVQPDGEFPTIAVGRREGSTRRGFRAPGASSLTWRGRDSVISRRPVWPQANEDGRRSGTGTHGRLRDGRARSAQIGRVGCGQGRAVQFSSAGTCVSFTFLPASAPCAIHHLSRPISFSVGWGLSFGGMWSSWSAGSVMRLIIELSSGLPGTIPAPPLFAALDEELEGVRLELALLFLRSVTAGAVAFEDRLDAGGEEAGLGVVGIDLRWRRRQRGGRGDDNRLDGRATDLLIPAEVDDQAGVLGVQFFSALFGRLALPGVEPFEFLEGSELFEAGIGDRRC